MNFGKTLLQDYKNNWNLLSKQWSLMDTRCLKIDNEADGKQYLTALTQRCFYLDSVLCDAKSHFLLIVQLIVLFSVD